MNAPARIEPPVSSAFSRRNARALPATFDEADNSFEVCWTTGAAVTRFDWYDGEYYDETLSLARGAVRLDRLNDSGPVLDSHRDDGLAGLLGSIVPGTARIQDGKGLARVRLADSPDLASVIAKVKGGHLRKVSVGYMVHVFERIEHGDGRRAEMRAVDWEPVEISLVAVPADPGAQIRSEDRPMPVPERVTEERSRHPSSRQPAQIEDAVTAAFVRQQCAVLGIDSETTLNLIETYTDEPTTRAEFLEHMVTLVARQQRAGGFVGIIDSAETGDRHRPMIDARISDRAGGDFAAFGAAAGLAQRMSAALYARISGKAPADEAREFMGTSLIDMARGLLEARGERVRWLSPQQVYQRFGGMTTSDFTLLLGGAMNSFLTEQYQASPSPLLKLAKSCEVRDFRPVNILGVTDSPELLLVPELAEFTQTALAETGESYPIATYGRILSISRQLIINDNLAAFVASGRWFTQSGIKARANFLAALIQSNSNMADGNPLFHASHGNLAGAGGAISVTTLSAARQAMRAQKDLDGQTILDVVPKYLVTGPAKETEAEQVLTQLSAVSQPSEVNPFPGKLELVVDPRLIGNAWYLFADPEQHPVLEYATLQGQGDSVFTETRMGFEVDGLQMKARIDWGGGYANYRGAYKNPGN